MKLKKNYFLVLFLTVLSQGSLESKPSNDDYSIGVNLLKKKFPEMKIISREEVSNDCELTSKDNPGIVKLDLNGDGIDDYVFLFQPYKGKMHHYIHERDKSVYDELELKLAFIISGKSGKFKIKIMQESGLKSVMTPFIVCLQLMKAGMKLEGWKGNSYELSTSITLKFDAVSLEYCGQRAVVYFWDGKRIESILNGD